jgi:ATP adenylyltransferase
MDHLWAPWRAQYIREGTGPVAAADACFFCRGLAAPAGEDRANLLAWRRPGAAVFLNRFPYNNGHLLVAPLAHRGRLEDFSGPELTAPLETVRDVLAILDGLLRPQGYNVGLNLGTAAGAGVPGHLHWHVVPRWDGDTNFMPVLAGAKVIVESLDELYDRLSQICSQFAR